MAKKPDDKITRIEDKIDKLGGHLSSIDVTLARQEASLSEHIRRTALLEDKIEPIENHVSMVSGIVRFIGIVATVAAIGEGLAVVLEYLGR